jgi:hypothetical protein
MNTTTRKRTPPEPTGWDGGWWECAATCPAEKCPRRDATKPEQEALPLGRRIARGLRTAAQTAAMLVALVIAAYVGGQIMLAARLDDAARAQVAVMAAAVVLLVWAVVIVRHGRRRR